MWKHRRKIIHFYLITIWWLSECLVTWARLKERLVLHHRHRWRRWVLFRLQNRLASVNIVRIIIVVRVALVGRNVISIVIHLRSKVGRKVRVGGIGRGKRRRTEHIWLWIPGNLIAIHRAVHRHVHRHIHTHAGKARMLMARTWCSLVIISTRWVAVLSLLILMTLIVVMMRVRRWWEENLWMMNRVWETIRIISIIRIRLKRRRCWMT